MERRGGGGGPAAALLAEFRLQVWGLLECQSTVLSPQTRRRRATQNRGRWQKLPRALWQPLRSFQLSRLPAGRAPPRHHLGGLHRPQLRHAPQPHHQPVLGGPQVVEQACGGRVGST